MLTLNQYNETNKKRTSVNNMTFNGGSAVLTKIKPVAADSLTMSSNAKFNAEAKKWLKSAFSEKDGLPSLFYEKCLNSDNNISETALNFLKDEVENKKTLLSRLFKRKGHFAYQNFGDKFLAIMLEAVKNNEENHTDENIGFLRTVLDNYQSENPRDYLDIVVKCKDKNGNVNAKIPNLFNGLSSQIYQYGYKFITIMLDAVKNNEENHTDSNIGFLETVLNNYKSDSPRDYLDIVINSKDKNGNINKNFSYIFTKTNCNLEMYYKLLKLVQGNNSEKLIEAISEDLKGHHPNWMADCLGWSKDANNESNLYNYRKILYDSISVEQCTKYEKEIRDAKGIIQDSNVYVISELQKLFDDSKLSEDFVRKAVKAYFLFLADNQNVANKEFADKFIDVIKSVDYQNDYLNVLQVAESLKNKKGEISDEALKCFNVLYSFRNSAYKSALASEYGKAFPKTLLIIKDEYGNIIPEFIPYISDLCNSGLTEVVPHILQLSRGKGGKEWGKEEVKEDKLINKEIFEGVKNFILKYSAHQLSYYTMAQKLTTLVDKDGHFDIKTLNVLTALAAANPAYDAFDVCSAIKNPDGKISDEGLKFAETMLKEIPNRKDVCIFMINYSKDKQGVIQDSNIYALTELEKLLKHKIRTDVQTFAVVREFIDYLKDDKGVVNKEFAGKFIKALVPIITVNTNYTHVLNVADQLKNKKGEIPDEALNNFGVFTYLKYSADKAGMGNETLTNTVEIIKDDDGNIIPDFIPYISDLSNKGFETSVPYILQIARGKDGKGGNEDTLINKEIIEAAKVLISKYAAKDRPIMAKRLTTLVDKDGHFDIKTLNIINKLMNINSICEPFGIYSAVKNPDGEISDIGLEFAEGLLKNFKSQKNDFFINTINLAKDKNGKFNDNNISFIKRLSAYTDKIKEYTEAAKDSDGIVDKNFGDNLIGVLSTDEHPEDYKSILASIKLLQNQKGENQWQYVYYISALKRLTDKSSDAQKHDTLNRILKVMTDKDGNILPSFDIYAIEINEMVSDGLLTEIPIILSMSQKDGVLDSVLCSTLKTLVLNEPKDKRYQNAKRLMDIGKNNGFDKDFFLKLSKIIDLKINGDKYKILGELKNSDGKISQFGFDFLVYLRKDCHIKEEKEIISFLQLSKNKIGDFSDKNIEYIKDISKIIPKFEIAKIYINASKKSTGMVDKDYYDNLIKILSKHEHPEDYKNILSCLNLLKNKKDETQWQYLNDLYKLKIICNESKMGKEFKTFNNIVEIIKDSNGNIVPELFKAAEECRHEKMLYEIPTIISVSKKNDQLDKDNYKKVVQILKDTATEDRYKMSEYIKEQADKTGSLSVQKIKTIERLQATGISKNLLKLCHYLKNPDGSISVTGLNLLSDLRKNYHHQIEPDLVKIIKVCRDKTGYMNKKNVDAIKEILETKKGLDTVGLVKSTLDRKGEVDDEKFKMVLKLITEHKMSDTATINKIINMARDKKGNIDSSILKLFVELAKKGKKPEDYKSIIPAYKALYKYEHAISLSQLNLRQKRDLMRALKRYYHSDMQSYQFKEILSSKLFPSDESEYCSVMGRLSHSIGISITRLSKDLETKYYKAMKTLENPKGDFMKLDFDKNPPVLELKYPLDRFKHDIADAVANYSYSERTKALDFYGFELKKEDGILRLSGFPNSDKPDGTLKSIKDKRVLHLINKLSPYVIDFVSNNNVTVKGSKEMSEAFTDIIRAFPEFLTTIKKKQHHTHDFTLDVHCLKVLQDVFSNPEYKTLSHTDRKEMQLIALFHDLSKTESQVDNEHPENSAFNVYYILNKLGLKEKDKLEIYNVIRNHDWLTHFDFSEYAAKDIAFNMRGGESLKMLLMLSQGDLKGVKKNDIYYKMHGHKLKKAGLQIEPYLRDLQRTAIHLPQTKIPKASELNQHSSIVDKIHADGITNMVLYLKPNYDLGKAGFKTCRSTDDFNVLVHGLDNKDAAAMFQALGIIDSDALLSTSYILYSKGNYRAFRNEGFVLDVPATNIHVAYWRDFGSGYKKTIRDTLYNTYLFRNNPTREYISGELKQELGLRADKEYIQLFKEIEDMPIEELEKKHPHTAHAYKKIFNNMEISKRNYNRNYNEVLLSSPKIQGIFCYGKSPESVSDYLRRYAERNDIPIIVFG